VYWLTINEEVKNYVSKKVISCAYQPDQGQELMLPNSVPDRPQTKVAVDLFQLQNQYFLITLDYFGNLYKVQMNREGSYI